MPFLLLLFLTLVCMPDQWDAPWTPFARADRSAALTWAGVAFVGVVARGIALIVRRGAFRPETRSAAIHWYGRWRFRHSLLLLATYAVAMYGFGWGWTVQQVVGGLPGAELLVLAPFFCTLLLSWVAFYDAERALHDSGRDDSPFWTRGAYVGFHVRQNVALVLVPILLMVLMKGLRRALPESDELSGWVSTLGGIGIAVAVFLSMPLVLRLVLGLKPLPDGPLRDRLMAAARRLDFRFSDILLWNTRNGVANAMVAGLIPQVRYVLLTDRLIEDMTPDEVEAVFGHEVGHVKHSHMLYYLGFLKVSLIALFFVYSIVGHYLDIGQEVDTATHSIPLVALLGTYIIVVFGFLSRRCERQADLYGCRAVSCAGGDCAGHSADVALVPGGRGLCPTGIGIFIDALEKVALLNGISRDRPGWFQSWQHSTIARRVAFLQGVRADPALARRFQRRVALIKWGLIVGLTAALVGLFAVLVSLEPKEVTPPQTAGHTALWE